MPDEQRGQAVYTVQWGGEGYEVIMQQMREFLQLKRQVDAAMKSNAARGPNTGNVGGFVNPAGQPLRSSAQSVAQTDRDRVDREYTRSTRAAASAMRDHARTIQDAAHRQRRVESQAASQNWNRRFTQRQNTPAVFANVHTGGFKTDQEWLDYYGQLKQVREEALKNGKDLNAADRKIFSSTSQIAGIINQRKNAEKAAEHSVAKTGILNRIINTAGWLPGMPPELYYGQMALGEAGAGLGPAGVAAGLGIGALGAVGMGLYNTSASELQMQRMLAGMMPGGNGSVVRPADRVLAANITQTGVKFGRTQDKMFGLLPTAAQYNLGPSQLQTVITGGLTRASEGQLTDQQGVQLQAQVTRLMGGDAAAAQKEFVLLGQAIKDTGVNTHTFYTDIIQLGQGLQAGTDLTGFAGIDASLKGTGLNATDIVGNAVTSSGVPRLVQAAALGMSESQYIALQKNPMGMAIALQKYSKTLMGKTGSPSATEAILSSEGFGFDGQNANAAFDALQNGDFQKYLDLTQKSKSTVAQMTPQQVSDATISATNAAITANNLSLDLGSRLGLVKQEFSQGALNAWQHPETIPGTTGRLASEAGADPLISAMAGVGNLGPGSIPAAIASVVAQNIVHHLIDIVIKDPNGNVLGSAQTSLGGSSSQTQTSGAPGAPPDNNVGTHTPSTPNATNTNGRTSSGWGPWQH